MFIKKYYNHNEYYNEFLQLHKINSPAIITDHAYYYYQNGKKHNPNGPAIKFDYNEIEYYFLYGTQIQKEDLNSPITYLKLKYDIPEQNIQILS